MRPLFSLIAILSTFSVYSQYTEVINSNRPGVSKGPFSVGTGVLQFEGGFQYRKVDHELRRLEATGFDANLEIRYGFLLEQLELSAEVSYEFADYLFQASGTELKESGLKQTLVGAKYLVFDPWKKEQKPNLYSWNANNKFQWRDLLPAVSVFAGANLYTSQDPPFTFPNEFSVSPRVMVATQHNFLGSLVLVTNFSYANIGQDFPEYGYVVTLTHSFNGNWSLYVENQGVKSDNYADVIFRGGLAYLLNKDIQVEATYGGNFKNTPFQVFGNIGISYRIDNHQDKEIKNDEFSKKTSNINNKKERKRQKAKNSKKKFEDDGGL